VIIAKALQVKAIAQAEVKSDCRHASPSAGGGVPQIRTPDAENERKRRRVARLYSSNRRAGRETL
jgi:hypothetical protein